MSGRKRARDQNVFPGKRRQRFLVEEITYDPQARQEYLTGFHKRKVQRQKQAQETAALKEKEERRRQRAEVRAERQTYIEKHLAMVNGTGYEEAGLNEATNDPESADSPNEEATTEIVALNREMEFDDEERAATVTVQAVDVTRDGLQPQEDPEASRETPQDRPQGRTGPNAQTPRRGPSKPPTHPKHKKKKFRYESKTENKLNRAKERASGKAKGKSRK